MKHITVIPFFALGLLLFSGMSFSETNAELAPNQAHLVEGSGFAVTDQSIKISQIDLLMSTGIQTGSSIRTVVEDGFVTMDEIDFVVEDISGSILREGRFIRLVGTAESSIGNQVTVSLFGKLVQSTDEGSIYSFSGKLTQGAESNKIIYTTKISTLGQTTPISSSIPSTTSQENEENIIHILQGASSISTGQNYITGTAGAPQQLSYFSQDRITVDPGTSITIVNDDDVPHTIVSGTGLGGNSRASQGAFVLCAEDDNILPEGFSYAESGCSFTMDGRINTNEILPGQSVSVTFENIGFYRLINPDYPWMSITAYSFHDVDSLIIGYQGESFN